MSHRILIVDDSVTVRMDLAEAFAGAGFEVELCGTLEGARRALSSEKLSLLVLDVVLPDGDGVEFLAELRQRDDTRALPIVLLSAEAEVEDRIRGLKEGADEYVGKPYDAAYVIARVSALLRSFGDSASRSILVIDDSLTYREELASLVRDAGYTVVTAASGEEGLLVAAHLRPDAIIVDGVMPGIDGTEVIKRIRLDPGLQATPCLLLTSSEGAASEVDALDAGADAYAHKSESTELVLTRLGAMLRSAQESRERGGVSSLMGPKRILTVDDNAMFLELVGDELREEGYEVIKARSGEEALKLLSFERVDGILLDLHMPGMSGSETCRQIKASPALRNVPLIMVSSSDDARSMVDGMNAGADDYIKKSADLGVLKARLRAQLRRKHFEDETRRVREEILQKEAESRAARELAETRSRLLSKLQAKNRELQGLNQELEMFAYTVSHDLRQPLRGMDGFSKVLLEEYGDVIDERGRHYLERVRAGAQRMGELIEGLLVLSRVGRRQLRPQAVNLERLAKAVFQRLCEGDPSRRVSLVCHGPLMATADGELVEAVLENLLGNAWKFTARLTEATIEVGTAFARGATAFYVKDNGAGFSMDYADKLFQPFQRLHSQREFTGTGIGLATVQRIIHRHGGELWGEAAPGEGATFYFTLTPVTPARADVDMDTLQEES